MVLSAALNRMIQKGANVKDAGAEQMVARWWSLRTKNQIGSWQEASECALFHLPACKEYLAREYLPFETPSFLAGHRAWARGRLPRELVKVVRDRLRGEKSYLPQVL